MRIGIIGNGFVGEATGLLACDDVELLVYDRDPTRCCPKGTTLQNMVQCELVFVCVPTPMNINGECQTGIVKQVVGELKELGKDTESIVVRSTVPPGTCDSVGSCFMPEFLTESKWGDDFYNCQHWVFGTPSNESHVFETRITELFTKSYQAGRIKYNNLHFVRNSEAELLKYFRNTFLATKVSFCNEIEQYCRNKSIDYSAVRDLVALDPRFTRSHLDVPGPDGKRGYGGTCFPKDTNALCYEMSRVGVTPMVLGAVVTRNETIDRQEKDWTSNLNRAVVTHQSRRTIMVTGGAGFIGNHLCRNLLEDPDNFVICVDSFVSGNRENIKDLETSRRFILYEHDIIQPIRLNLSSLDQIYHLACVASPPLYQQDPIHTTQTCVTGTVNMLEVAKRYGAKLLLTSTSEVYGDPETEVQSESYRGNVNCHGPRSCYDEGKRTAESLVMDYHRVYSLDISIARIFNTYGPKMNPYDGRVVSNFIRQCLAGDPITIYGGGTQTRSFCYVTDTVRGLKDLMESKVTDPVNIGNPENYNIQQLAEMIRKLTESHSEIVYKDLPEDDPRHRKPDITKAIDLLGWKPEVNVKTGLELIISSFK
jgi:UDP-glucuronate decarboxylase